MPVFTQGDRNLLFIHIPKTGGSSIERHLVDAGWSMSYHDGRMAKGKPNYLRRCTPQHMHGEMLRQTFRLDRFDAVFAVVRDPVARFRSEYVMRHKTDLSTSPEQVEAWAEGALARYAKNSYIHDNHIRPQVQFLVRGALVYRLEDGLDVALADLNERCGLDLPTDVAKVRTSEKTRGIASKDVVVSPALEARLETFYRDDFHRLGYRKLSGSGRSLLARAAGRASDDLARLAKRL